MIKSYSQQTDPEYIDLTVRVWVLKNQLYYLFTNKS